MLTHGSLRNSLPVPSSVSALPGRHTKPDIRVPYCTRRPPRTGTQHIRATKWSLVAAEGKIRYKLLLNRIFLLHICRYVHRVRTLRARTHITDGGVPKGNRRVSGLVKKEEMRRRGAEREWHMSARALTLGDSGHCRKTYAITRTRYPGRYWTRGVF
ncbi:hypothetical protein NDU88_008680 [Pleurodeles waltl]|uniref:Uncharacterized protein n=1 Tax=Pleurodeles waltl TaxID=8319 RepID=A0AAV7P5R4_PLEWA|nr:hypothetical protein NDU88_008680 [Pleurodeles waltl]